MNFRKAGKNSGESLDIAVTSLVDIVLILLIFFMVTTSFQSESRLAVNLPKAAELAEQQQHSTVEILIDPVGRYFVNGRQLKNQHPSALKQALREVSHTRQDQQSLVIRADASTPHQAVVTALDIAAQLGLVHVSIATLQQE